MKLAISTYSLLRWKRVNGKSLNDVIDVIADLGIEAIEFAALDEKPRSSAIRRRCASHGLIPVSYCVGAELLVPPAQLRVAVAALKSEVDVAAEIGVRSMRHDVTRGFGEWSQSLQIRRSFPAVLEVVVPPIRKVADYAARSGVRTSLENHGFYMQSSRRVKRLIQSVEHSNFGLTLDMGNFLCVNEDPVAAVKRLATFAQMVHAKDFHVRRAGLAAKPGWFATPANTELCGAIVGRGIIDIAAQINLLKHAGYDGYVSLEFEGLEEPLSAVRAGLKYLRRLL